MEPLAKIFGSPARLKMLRLFVFNQESSFTISDIVTRTKISKEVVRRELSDLCDAGLIRKRSPKTPIQYQMNSKFEHRDSLDLFVRDTTILSQARIISYIKKSGVLRLVVLTGLFTGVMEPRVDMLIVGDSLNERTLASAVHSLEAELGREIRYANFATSDFKYRLGVYDRLLRDVFDYPHRILVDKIGI